MLTAPNDEAVLAAASDERTRPVLYRWQAIALPHDLVAALSNAYKHAPAAQSASR